MPGKAGFQEHSRGCLYGLIHFYGDDRVNESELYKELGTLTKEKEWWETSISIKVKDRPLEEQQFLKLQQSANTEPRLAVNPDKSNYDANTNSSS